MSNYYVSLNIYLKTRFYLDIKKINCKLINVHKHFYVIETVNKNIIFYFNMINIIYLI